MCGICGVVPENNTAAEQLIEAIAHRGRDSKRIESVRGATIGHVLHALVDEIAQPVHSEKGTLLYNGEIYNWKDLAKQYVIDAKNDTQVLLHLLDVFGPQKIPELVDGVFAYAYISGDTLTLQRDVLGVKPLWYSAQRGFAFSSEKKSLERAGFLPRELHPRTTLTYTLSSGELAATVRELSFRNTSLSLQQALVAAVTKRIPQTNRVAVLFSGGIDSSLIALLLKQAGAKVELYVAALDDPEKSEPHDLLAARQAAQFLDLPLTEVRCSLQDVEQLLPTLCSRIEDSNVVKVGVALPLWLCAQKAAEDAHRVLFSGLGAEEVFAGYHRHTQALDINKECLRGLRMMHERDLYRDDVIAMSHTLEMRLPLLDHALISVGLAIASEEKILSGMGKMPLRNAALAIGLPKEIAFRPKKAAQYGSQFAAALDKLARQHKLSQSAYLQTLYPVNERLCALLSSGKDSVYALHTMQKMNYAIVCAATILSENPHSYMYHTPAISFAQKQAESLGIPWIFERTKGEKEEELSALKNILSKAMREYAITGIVSGALYSDYQRSRIEEVCEQLGLRVYAPLWHIDQEQEVREILDAGFTFVLSRVAADGLDKSWVGRNITHDDVDSLVQKLHLNVAGEGGEYESLVVDGPGFSFPLDISSCSIVCEGSGRSGDVCELVFPKDS